MCWGGEICLWISERFAFDLPILLGMSTTYRFADLVEQGHDEYSIRTQVRSGELSSVRHGGYALDLDPDSPEARHRALIRTTVPLLNDDAVLSHCSAALLWGLPVPRRLLTKVHVTHDRPGGGHVRTWTHTHSSALPSLEIAEVEGLRITSLARTAVDTARLCSNQEALQIVDAAWRMLDTPTDLAAACEMAGRCHGIRAARWALAHADPRSESPGESLSRYWMIMGKIPTPTLQLEILDPGGNFVARADFAWEEYRVLGEFDGRIKYASSLNGQPLAEVVMREKERENRLRALGWWVYRWTWDDLRHGQRFAADLRHFLDESPFRRTR